MVLNKFLIFEILIQTLADTFFRLHHFFQVIKFELRSYSSDVVEVKALVTAQVFHESGHV